MNRKVNILIINHSFDIGGIEILVLRMCEAIDRSRFNICLCSFQDVNTLEKEFKKIQIPIYSLKKKEGIDYSLFFKLQQLIRKLNIDILHTHNSGQWFYGVGASLFFLFKLKIIHTQHSILEKNQAKQLLLLKLFSLRTYKVVCVGEYVRKYLKTVARISDSKLCLIYNGVNFINNSLNENKSILKASIGIPNYMKVIGIVARLVLVKNHKALLLAFRTIVNTNKNLVLLIVGDGELFKELNDFVCRLNIKDNVIFLGNRRDVLELMKIMDIFVLCSLSEGLSLTLLEAASIGLPIIATDVGGNKEIVVNNQTGLLVPADNHAILAERLLYLFKNPSIAKTLGYNAINYCKEKFNLLYMIEAYSQLYSHDKF